MSGYELENLSMQRFLYCIQPSMLDRAAFSLEDLRNSSIRVSDRSDGVPAETQ